MENTEAKAKRSETNKKYWEANKDRFAAYRRTPEYRARNRALMKKRYADPTKKFQHDQRVARGAIIRAIRDGQPISERAGRLHKSLDLLGCCEHQFAEYLQAQFTGGMSWDTYGSVWELDEIVPVSAFDFADREQIAACYHFTNCRPLAKLENRGSPAIDYTADVSRAVARVRLLSLAANEEAE